MKISSEKHPKSLVVLDVELDQEQVEAGLNRAARRLSQKYAVPGFRKGKAPRFIIENYFGRGALMEEASEDLINRSFRTALEQSELTPVGQPTLESVDSSETFRFRVSVPVPPSIELANYREIRVERDDTTVDDDMVQRAMDVRRDRHVVLQELDEPRPAQQGDQLTVKLETFVDGEPLEDTPEGEEIPDSTLVLEPERLVPELYEGLLGMSGDETREIVAHMPEDHENEQVRGKDVTFKVRLVGIQERKLPDWDELPVLEEFEGSLDEMRQDTRNTIEERMQNEAESKLVDSFLQQLMAQTDYDIPDVMIRETANDMLEEYGQQFSSYGITIDQMLQYRGQTRDDAINEILESAEERLKTRLALQQIVEREQIEILPDEVETEANKMLANYDEATREQITGTMADQFYMSIANTVLDRKLRERLIAIATGEAPELPAAPEAGEADEAAAEVGAASTPEAEEPAEPIAASPAEEAGADHGEPDGNQETKTDT